MTEPRLYGNWLRPQTLSFRGVGWKGAAVAATGYFVGLATVQSHPRFGTALLAGCVLITVTSAVRIGGASLPDFVTGRARWRYAETTGRTRFKAVDTAGWQLPGPLAGTRMVTVSAGGRVYGAVHDPTARRLAVTLDLASTAADLTDDAEHDRAVARWERWLEALGRRPEVAKVVITVETAPSAGTRLREEVQRRLSALAPPDCQTLMEALVVASPAVAARIQTRAIISFDLRAWDSRVTRADRRRGVHAFLPLLTTALDGLEADLDGCGVTVLGRSTPAQLAGAVRAAFDPHADAALEAGTRDVPAWELAGPASATEHRDRYVHDAATSVSFVWAQAPRTLVPSSVLDPLMRPGRFRKRVTCTYVATPAARAMDSATEQVRWRWAAEMVARLPVVGRPSTAQDERDTEAAQQSTYEIAAGAGWVTQIITATVTVLDADELPAAVAELEHAAGASQLRLRRLFDLQAAGFAAGLPAGLSLPELAERWNR